MIYCRFGTLSHLLVMFWAVLVNLFVISFVLDRGTQILSALITGRLFYCVYSSYDIGCVGKISSAAAIDYFTTRLVVNY